jgi:glucuronoarabinoxylan endo-1,4-beta-xylanase
VYRSVLASEPYRDSWRFLRRLDHAGLKIALAVWGGPPQFTMDGTRLGQLKPEHYDDYVEYVATVVDFIVREQHAPVWAITIANEPDGGDGTRIPPEGLLYIARQLAPRLTAQGVKLYGPDTSSAAEALDYLPLLLDDPTVSEALAFVGFHEYSASPDVGDLVRYVRQRRPDLPVVVTEYTSFRFGDLDDGQEASDELGFMLDVVNTALSHYRHGVDAAVYWDVVDYLQPGHDAITKWGLLRGPADNFERRQRYHGLLQVLRHLQPGAVVLDCRQEGGDDLGSLTIRTADGGLAVFLVNLGSNSIELDLAFEGAAGPSSLVLLRTDSRAEADRLGPVQVREGRVRVSLPGRSVTTLLSPDPAAGPATAN